AVHVHGHHHDVHVAGTLAIAQQRALHTVGASHHTQFRSRDGTATVVVGVQTDDHGVATVDTAAEPLDLISVDVGCCHLHGRGQVEDHLALRGWLPYFGHGIADFHREVRLGASEALRRILEYPLGLRRLLRAGQHLPGPIDSNVADTVTAQLEDLLALHH